MTKSKTNALESLRGLIAERQQYEQWITTLESKREGTPPHVFERVQGDYSGRLQRVIGEIKGHAEELQLSISTLSTRLVEVARDEDSKRDSLQEAELRATVGEYEPQEWEQLKAEAEQGLERIAADRAVLDTQLSELRSIQKLSEVGSTGSVAEVDVAEQAAAPETAAPPEADAAQAEAQATIAPESPESIAFAPPESVSGVTPSPYGAPRDQGNFPLEDAAAASAAVLSSPPPVPTAQPVPNAPSQFADSGSNPVSNPSPNSNPTPPRPRSGKTPPFGGVTAKPKQAESRTDQSKTLKCPECGTPNYPTEWYCERCGGELATM